MPQRMPAGTEVLAEPVPAGGVFNAALALGAEASAVVNGTIGLPSIDTFVAVSPSSSRCSFPMSAAKYFCCSASLESCSRMAVFSLRISWTSVSRFDGGCGACALAEMGNDHQAGHG